MNQKMTFDILIDDILLNICRYLTYGDVLRICLSNSRLKIFFGKQKNLRIGALINSYAYQTANLHADTFIEKQNQILNYITLNLNPEKLEAFL